MTRRANDKVRGASRGRREAPAAAGKLVRAPEATKLTPEQKRRIDEIADGFGEWLDDFEVKRKVLCNEVLEDVFGGDAVLMASSDRLSNEGLQYLLRRIERDGRITVAAFNRTLRVAAYDHLVRGRFWKRVGYGVKERLLPLVDAKNPAAAETLKLLDAAAKHAIEFDLSSTTTKLYVDELLLEGGRAVRRNARFKTFAKHLDRSVLLFDGAAAVTRLEQVTARIPAAEVAALELKLKRAAQALLNAAKKLKEQGKG